MSLMSVKVDKLNSKIEKTFFYNGKMVHIISIQLENKVFCFKIWDKSNKKDYYSDTYIDAILCEKDSMKVVRKI